MPPLPAETINTRYEIIETLPAPDAAPFQVSKARDITEGRVVSLSVLPVDASAASHLRDLFLAAAQAAIPLDHPAIARVYDFGVTGETNNPYVVTEYVRGITLKERSRRVAPFALAITADIAVAVASALEYAHRKSVAHGDLRPENVLLSPEGQIKVVGFRYSRVAAALAVPNDHYNAYQAPELQQSDSGTVAADLYALGACLYEMLTGQLPPSAGSSTSPALHNSGIPPALDGIVQKALLADPMARYRTATAILTDLRAVRDGLRTGRSLTWTPLAVAPAPQDKPAELPRQQGVLTAAAQDLEAERMPKEEEYSELPRSGGSRALSILLTFLFIAAVLSVIGLTWFITRSFAIPSDISVPNLIGKPYDEAQRIAQQQHFTLTKGASDYSDKWPENQIYQQDPPAGGSIKSGQSISVLVSMGPRLLRVPNLVGELKDRAGQDLQAANLPVGTVAESYSEKVAAGVVISQTPDANGMVARNTAVNYTVSKGPQPPEAPADVEANSTVSDTVELTWKAAPRAQSYTVIRSEDGNDTTIAKNITDTHLTDRGLTPDTFYSYVVNSTNAAGTSGPSDPAPVTTPAPPVPAPALDNSQIQPPDGSDDGTSPDSSDTSTKMRPFTIRFRVPRHPYGGQRVQIEVQDATGTSQVYDEIRPAASVVDAPITAFGNKVTIRIFLNGKLVRQTTK